MTDDEIRELVGVVMSAWPREDLGIQAVREWQARKAGERWEKVKAQVAVARDALDKIQMDTWETVAMSAAEGAKWSEAIRKVAARPGPESAAAGLAPVSVPHWTSEPLEMADENERLNQEASLAYYPKEIRYADKPGDVAHPRWLSEPPAPPEKLAPIKPGTRSFASVSEMVESWNPLVGSERALPPDHPSPIPSVSQIIDKAGEPERPKTDLMDEQERAAMVRASLAQDYPPFCQHPPRDSQT